VPATEKADNLTKKFDLTRGGGEFENLQTSPSIHTPSSKSSSFMKDDYMMNRDPLKEFFALVSIHFHKP
jgi:hypothetical protein